MSLINRPYMFHKNYNPIGKTYKLTLEVFCIETISEMEEISKELERVLKKREPLSDPDAIISYRNKYQCIFPDCKYFTFQLDNMGDVAITHCTHKDNPHTRWASEGRSRPAVCTRRSLAAPRRRPRA